MLDRFGFRRSIDQEVHGDIRFMVGKIFMYPIDEFSFSNVYMKINTGTAIEITELIKEIEHVLEQDATWLAKRYNVEPKE